MYAKNIRPGNHSVKGKNVAQVRNWRLLTEVVLPMVLVGATFPPLTSRCCPRVTVMERLSREPTLSL